MRAGHKAAGDGGRSVFLSRHYSYHGVMLGGTSAGGLPANRDPFGTLLPDFFQVGRDSLDAMREAVAYYGPERIAAIMAEPVIGAGGVFPPPAGISAGLARAVRRVRRAARVRRGDHRLRTARVVVRLPSLRGHARRDDLRQGVTSGYLPLGGVIVGPRLRGWLEADPWLSARTRQHLRRPSHVLRGRDRQPRADARRGVACARGGGRALASARGSTGWLGHPGVAEVRGEGLMQAVALAAAESRAFTEALLARGVIGRGLGYANSVAFSPPLIISDEEVDELVSADRGRTRRARAEPFGRRGPGW